MLTWYLGLVWLHISLCLIFNVQNISLVNVRHRARASVQTVRLSRSLFRSQSNCSQKKHRSSPSPPPLFMINLNWNEEKSLQQNSFLKRIFLSHLQRYKVIFKLQKVTFTGNCFEVIHFYKNIFPLLHHTDLCYIWIKLSWDSNVGAWCIIYSFIINGLRIYFLENAIFEKKA